MKMTQNNEFPDELHKELEKYNLYVQSILNEIKDFDVWYESFYNKEFPKNWYAIIKSHNSNLDT